MISKNSIEKQISTLILVKKTLSTSVRKNFLTLTVVIKFWWVHCIFDTITYVRKTKAWNRKTIPLCCCLYIDSRNRSICIFLKVLIVLNRSKNGWGIGLHCVPRTTVSFQKHAARSKIDRFPKSKSSLKFYKKNPLKIL